jgi:hypothetical protein
MVLRHRSVSSSTCTDRAVAEQGSTGWLGWLGWWRSLFNAPGRRETQRHLERRHEVRLRCRAAVSCQAAHQPVPSQQGESCDLSFAGLSVRFPKFLPPGMLVTVTLHNPKGGGLCTRLWLVAHCQPHPRGGWLLGGSFYRELTDKELSGVCD